jgi:hypothetical protein
MNGERIWLWLPKMEHVYDWWFNFESIFNHQICNKTCTSLCVSLSFFPLAIALFVFLWITVSDYPFGIFKLFLMGNLICLPSSIRIYCQLKKKTIVFRSPRKENSERIWLWLPKMEHVYDWWFNFESIFNNDFIIQHCL